MVTAAGTVNLLDFGLAKLRTSQPQDSNADTQHLTFPGVICGTPAYMSPEQASGRALDHRSDQFSAGAIFYELATGRHPFQRGSAAEMMAAMLEAPHRPLSELNPPVSAAFCSAVHRCLSKDPAGRFDSTSQLVTALTAQPVKPLGLKRRTSGVAAAAILLAALAGLGAGLAWWRQEPSAPARACRS